MDKHIVITIARQYGSGGRTVGEMLAEKLNISRIHLAHIEIGSKAPSIDLMIVLAQFFGVTLDYLVLGR